MTQKILVVSAYIHEAMYRSRLILNPNLLPYEICGVDNRAANRGLPEIYNEVIAEYVSRDLWFCFVHEDLEIRGSMESLGRLDRRSLYGTFGVRLEGRVPVAYGNHVCSRKDGTGSTRLGVPVSGVVKVDALDCQCIIAHTQLFREFPQLRFDENLSFDLYGEELCMQARLRHGLSVYVCGIEAQHYSFGQVTERYGKGLEYIASKYPYDAVAGACSFIGGAADDLRRYFTYDIEANRAVF